MINPKTTRQKAFIIIIGFFVDDDDDDETRARLVLLKRLNELRCCRRHPSSSGTTTTADAMVVLKLLGKDAQKATTVGKNVRFARRVRAIENETERRRRRKRRTLFRTTRVYDETTEVTKTIRPWRARSNTPHSDDDMEMAVAGDDEDEDEDEDDDNSDDDDEGAPGASFRHADGILEVADRLLVFGGNTTLDRVGRARTSSSRTQSNIFKLFILGFKTLNPILEN